MHSSTQTPPPPTTVGKGGAGDATFSDVHPDIIGTHILTRLDGPSLASLSCASTQLHSISAQQNLWSHLCHATWPSLNSPRMRHVISTFPDGPKSFFADSFPLPISDPTDSTSPNQDRPSSVQVPAPSELISAVDIYYKNELIHTKVQEIETVSGWFQCSPFRVDLLDAKDVVPTPIKQDHHDDDTCTALAGSLTLSWIMIDPINRRSMNLSSFRPVTVQRHWLSGEVQARFAWILAAGCEKGSASEFVQCEIVVTCGGGGPEEGETTTTMQVREISLVMEDMDGIQLRGKESMVILQRAMEGKRGIMNGNVEEGGERRYMEFLERKRERRERKLRTEGRLDSLCMAFGVSIFAAFAFFFFF